MSGEDTHIMANESENILPTWKLRPILCSEVMRAKKSWKLVVSFDSWDRKLRTKKALECIVGKFNAAANARCYEKPAVSFWEQPCFCLCQWDENRTSKIVNSNFGGKYIGSQHFVTRQKTNTRKSNQLTAWLGELLHHLVGCTCSTTDLRGYHHNLWMAVRDQLLAAIA